MKRRDNSELYDNSVMLDIDLYDMDITVRFNVKPAYVMLGYQVFING